MRAVLVGEQSPLVLEEQRRIAEAKAQEVEAARVIMEAERSTAEQRAQEAEAALQLARVQAQALVAEEARLREEKCVPSCSPVLLLLSLLLSLLLLLLLLLPCVAVAVAVTSLHRTCDALKHHDV